MVLKFDKFKKHVIIADIHKKKGGIFMKINWNKVCYLVLGSIAIALASILSALLLLTDYTVLTYISFFGTYLFGIYFMKTQRKYKLMK